MTADRLVFFAWFAMGMVLVVSSLMARRLPASRMLALALLWAGIFAVGYAIARLLT